MSYSKAEKIFVSYLHKKGLKFTPQRKIVLEYVLQIESHFEAEDLLLKIRKSGQRVSKGTIYRTLPLLTDCRIIREVLFVEKHAHYERVYGHKHHEHLFCLKCGKIINFLHPGIEAALGEICREKKFQAKAHKVEVTGYCTDCRKNMG